MPSSFSTLAGATPAVQQNDFFRVETISSLPADYKGKTIRTSNDTIANPLWIEGVMEASPGRFIYSYFESSRRHELFQDLRE
jgi:hypothetical protein